jgi:hypothetical protein
VGFARSGEFSKAVAQWAEHSSQLDACSNAALLLLLLVALVATASAVASQAAAAAAAFSSGKSLHGELHGIRGLKALPSKRQAD